MPTRGGLESARDGNGARVRMGRRNTNLLGALYLVVGLVVAATKEYLENVDRAQEILSAVLAVVLWPLLFLGVDLHVEL